MEVTTVREWDTVIARPSGKIDGSNSDGVLKALEGAIQPTDKALILDMERVTYISSAGLRIVAIMINRTKVSGMKFALCSLSKQVDAVVTASGFNRLVGVVATREDARMAVTD